MNLKLFGSSPDLSLRWDGPSILEVRWQTFVKLILWNPTHSAFCACKDFLIWLICLHHQCCMQLTLCNMSNFANSKRGRLSAAAWPHSKWAADKEPPIRRPEEPAWVALISDSVWQWTFCWIVANKSKTCYDDKSLWNWTSTNTSTRPATNPTRLTLLQWYFTILLYISIFLYISIYFYIFLYISNYF